VLIHSDGGDHPKDGQRIRSGVLRQLDQQRTDRHKYRGEDRRHTPPLPEEDETHQSDCGGTKDRGRKALHKVSSWENRNDGFSDQVVDRRLLTPVGKVHDVAERSLHIGDLANLIDVERLCIKVPHAES